MPSHNVRRSALVASAVIGLATCLGCIRMPFTFVPVVEGPGAITLPPGFAISEFATGLSGPRFMALGPGGEVLIALRDSNTVTALLDLNGDGIAGQARVIVADLDAPTSLAFRDGRLYIGETSRVTRVDLSADLVASNRVVLIDGLPTGGHATRTVTFGSDGKLYVSIGSSCNVCVEADPRRAAVSVYDADGTNGRIFVGGIRNAVGLAVEPTSGAMWASNNGRDMMGDDLPPETIYILRDGANCGWPECHSGDIIDPDLGAPGACDGAEPPAAKLQAHMAPLGILFYDGEQFPPQYRGNLFIAFHGSWNRSIPVGYKVMMIPIAAGQPAGPAEDFATGWLGDDGTTTGRPAGLLVAADGALLVSDDAGGTVYRIEYVLD